MLEHVDRLDDAMESLRRVTRVGGVGLHLVDFCDHRFYTGAVASQLEFLKDRSPAPLLHGSNRLRCSQVASMFEAHGFSVERIEPARIAPLDEAERRQFVEPYRSMRTDDLAMVCARMFVRKR